MVKAILRGGGDYDTKVVALCSHFVDMGAMVKTQMENGISKLFDFQGQIIDVSDKDIFTLKDSGVPFEERNKINI